MFSFFQDGYEGSYPPPPQDEAFQTYEPYPAFHPSGAPHQHSYQGPPGPPTPPTAHHAFGPSHLDGHLQDVHSQMTGVESHHQAVYAHMTKTDPDVTGRGASNSEDDDLTPAQSRRKAQNRAA